MQTFYYHHPSTCCASSFSLSLLNWPAEEKEKKKQDPVFTGCNPSCINQSRSFIRWKDTKRGPDFTRGLHPASFWPRRPLLFWLRHLADDCAGPDHCKHALKRCGFFCFGKLKCFRHLAGRTLKICSLPYCWECAKTCSYHWKQQEKEASAVKAGP